MIELKTEYRHPFFPWKQTRKTGYFPENMEEITPAQFAAVVEYSALKISERKLLQTMTALPARAIKKLGDFQRFKLLQLLAFVAQTKGFNRFVIPMLKTSSGKLYSPKPKLKGLTFEQFIFADAYFSDYSEKQDPETLAKFVAALYLPKDKPFDESLIEANAPAIQKLETPILEGIFLNYGFLRDWLSEAYPLVFTASEQTATKNKQPATGNNGWIKIFETIVGDDIINAEKYGKTPIHNILRFLTERIKQNMKRK